MTVTETEAKSILRRHKKIDSWFVSHYGMNLYRGCLHNCVYCDGRAEGYYVKGDFGEDIEVKINAVDILQKELDPKRKRIPLKQGYMMIGGGVGDSYGPPEKKYELSKRTLELIEEYNFPVHILTKSTLVERDIDILKRINEKKRAIVSMSFSSVDDKISSIIEPGVPSPTERLKTLSFFKKEGIACGMFLLPVIPFITDKPELLEDSVKMAAQVGVDFIVFGGMTLKEGRQRDYFWNMLRNNYPDLTLEYQNVYKGDRWGNASDEYSKSLNQTFGVIAKKYRMPIRMPLQFFRDILSENDLTVVILEHIDYYLRLQGASSPYGYAAYSISQIKEPLSSIKGNLRNIKGIGKMTERIILEILNTRSSSLYQRLMYG